MTIFKSVIAAHKKMNSVEALVNDAVLDATNREMTAAFHTHQYLPMISIRDKRGSGFCFFVTNSGCVPSVCYGENNKKEVARIQKMLNQALGFNE
jgi:hypothetical protein